MRAGKVAARAHPALGAVLAERSVFAVGVAVSSPIAAGVARALWCSAANAVPTWVTGTLCKRRVARAMSSAVGTVARASGNFAHRAAEAGGIIADTHPITDNCSVPTASHIATHSTPARVAHAVARVHRVLYTVRARVQTAGAHPAMRAVLTHRLRNVNVNTVAVSSAERDSTAEWRLAAKAHPAIVARALVSVVVAFSVAGTRLTVQRTLWSG